MPRNRRDAEATLADSGQGPGVPRNRRDAEATFSDSGQGPGVPRNRRDAEAIFADSDNRPGVPRNRRDAEATIIVAHILRFQALALLQSVPSDAFVHGYRTKPRYNVVEGVEERA